MLNELHKYVNAKFSKMKSDQSSEEQQYQSKLLRIMDEKDGAVRTKALVDIIMDKA